MWIYTIILISVTIISMIVLAGRVAVRRSRIAKAAVLGNGLVFPILLWSLGALGYLTLGIRTDRWGGPFLLYLGAAGVAQLLYSGLRRWLRQHVEHYHMPCPHCRCPMQILGEGRQDAALSPQQTLETQAGGMQFEVWQCARCGHCAVEGIPVDRAEGCQKCGWRTAVLSEYIVVAPTETTAGKKRITASCINPACGYQVARDRKMAATGTGTSTTILDRTSDTPDEGDSSHFGGFGGGQSGGAGSTRGY